MMTDALTNFVQPGGLQSLVGADGAVIQVGAILDLLGAGVGVAPPSIIGNRPSGFYGLDPGIGRVRPEIQINIGTALTTGNGATCEFALQYAPDTGAAGNYQPGTWEDGNTTGFKAVGEYAASTVVKLDLPPAPPSTQTPRYVRIIARPNPGGATAAHFTAGTVNFAGLVMGRDDLANKNMGNNFTVA